MVLAPENTVAAFDLALGYGADVLEIDVRLSRDGHVIVTHDSRVDRTCNGQGKVRDHTLRSLKKLHAAWHFTGPSGQTFRNETISLTTLHELFLRYPDTRINIDIKDNSEQAAKAVADCIEQSNAGGRVNIGSFHTEALNKFRMFSPATTTAASQAEVARLYFTRNLHKQPKYEYLQIPTSYFGIPLAREGFINYAKNHNISVVYWTINTSKAMQVLVDRGVNGIVTDRVDLACKLLGKTKKTTT